MSPLIVAAVNMLKISNAFKSFVRFDFHIDVFVFAFSCSFTRSVSKYPQHNTTTGRRDNLELTSLRDN